MFFFCAGFIINISSDSILLGLKTEKTEKTGRITTIATAGKISESTNIDKDGNENKNEKKIGQQTENEKEKENQIVQTSYKIPRGYLFEYVSCANYCK